MKKYIALVLIFLLGIMMSCTPDPIDIELPEAKQKLVVSSQVIPNALMVVAVSKSFSALKSVDEDSTDMDALLEELLVKDAKVSISYNGITDSLFSLPSIPGVYFSLGTPQHTHTEYTLNIHDPETGLSVSSRAEMLDQVLMDSTVVSRKMENGIPVVDLEIFFEDPANEKNYYMVNVYQVDQDTTSSANFFTPTDGNTVTFLLDDADFESNAFNGSSQIRGWYSDTIAISLSNISEEYYRYLEVRKKSGGLFSLLTSEPINYPTNVVGGLGFFTTHFPDARIRILPPLIK